jgi:hypothetical protein
MKETNEFSLEDPVLLVTMAKGDGTIGGCLSRFPRCVRVVLFFLSPCLSLLLCFFLWLLLIFLPLPARPFFLLRSPFSPLDTKIKRLGHGAFGDAFLCSHKTNPGQFVLKQIRKAGTDDDPTELLPDWRNELAALSAVRSDHVVQVVESFEDAHDGYIVMEYCSCGNLRRLLLNREHAGQPLTEAVFHFLSSIFRH